MKRSIFLIAALFAATFANAKIVATLEHTFDNLAFIGDIESSGAVYAYGNIIIEWSSNYKSPYKIYDADSYELIATFNYDTYAWEAPRFIQLGDEIVIINCNKSGKTILYDQNSEPIVTLCSPNVEEESSYYFPSPMIKTDGEGGAIVIVYDFPTHKSHVWRLSKENSHANEVTIPKQSFRKYINKDQVLIDSNEKNYTVQGQEVK